MVANSEAWTELEEADTNFGLVPGCALTQRNVS